MRHLRLLVNPPLAVVAAALAVGAALALAGSVLAAATSVKMTETNNRYHFTPPTVTLAVGETVHWTNTTDTAHTVTSDSGTALASSQIAAGATFSHTFSTTGTFAYHCTIHPYMTGQVTVVATAAHLPATDTLAAAPAQPPTPPVVALAGLALAGLFAGTATTLRVARRRVERDDVR